MSQNVFRVEQKAPHIHVFCFITLELQMLRKSLFVKITEKYWQKKEISQKQS